MPIVGGGLLPNSQLLLPGLSAEVRKAVSKTTAAISRLAHELYAREPDVMIMLAVDEAASAKQPRYSLLQAPELPYSFASLGDLTTFGTAHLAYGLTHLLKERWETSFPLPLVTPSQLPAAFSLPLVSLGLPLSNLPLVALRLPLDATHDELHHLSELLGSELERLPQRSLIMGVGTLGHGSSKADSNATMYDRQFKRALEATPDQLVNLDSALRQQVKDTLWPAATLAWLCYGNHSVRLERTSYEAPTGLGYLVGQFVEL